MNIHEPKFFMKYNENADRNWTIFCWLLLHLIQKKYPNGLIFVRQPTEESLEVHIVHNKKRFQTGYEQKNYLKYLGKDFDAVTLASKEATIFRDLFENQLILIKGE